MSDNKLSQIPNQIGYYFAGFVDGEGSFNVSLRQKQDYKQKWQICPCFNVSQRDKTVLALMKHWFGCGQIKFRQDGLYMYEVNNYQMINDLIIPFFKKFNFLSANKKKNFSIFKQVIELMNRNEHLTEQGMQKILVLREELNKGKGRKRKYNINDVLGKSSTTIR